MRITVVSPHFPTRALPWRGVSHDEQLRLFAEAGHDVSAVVPLPCPRRWLAGRRIPDPERDGKIVVAHPRYPRVPRHLGGPAFALERWLFARAAATKLMTAVAPPDIVLAHSAALPGGLLGRIGHAVFVVTVHDHELYHLAPVSAIVRSAIVRTLRRADCAVYVSQALQGHAIALAGAHRNRVIPIGIGTHVARPAAPPHDFTVCTVGTLIPRKRVDQMLRVFARLAAERPDARLVIVGEGPERRALELMTNRLGMADKIELTGRLDARAVQERMARASVMALPSVRESLGAVYLEAMSLGVPALGTQGEGIAEHISHGVSGILVPPDDDETLLAELRALAADPDRARRIGEEGRRRFLAGPFSWRANVKAYLELFEELLRNRAMHTAAAGPI